MQRLSVVEGKQGQLLSLCPESVKLWLDFNHVLDQDRKLLSTEAVIECRLEELYRLQIIDPRIFWITLARISELALLVAGEYADASEYQAAGDLLVNPREIEVSVPGQSDPVMKERHDALSEQFAKAIGNSNPVSWLCRNTALHLKKGALLPHLQYLLISSGVFTADYLEGLDQRMGRVAETIAFLCAWQIGDSIEFHQRLNEAGPEERTFLLSNLCRFDGRHFIDMGEAIHTMVLGAENDCIYIKKGCRFRHPDN